MIESSNDEHIKIHTFIEFLGNYIINLDIWVTVVYIFLGLTNWTIIFSECPLDHYKSEEGSASSCTRCPDHSHTVSTTSNSMMQCTCDTGYEGPNGGPCTSKDINIDLSMYFTEYFLRIIEEIYIERL